MTHFFAHERPWIGVDFDGTLAVHEGPDLLGSSTPPAPVPAMVKRVKVWLAQGIQVKIVTARAADPETYEEQRDLIQAWCRHHVGTTLEVRHGKSYAMIALFDDRAHAVETNTGRLLSPTPAWCPE